MTANRYCMLLLGTITLALCAAMPLMGFPVLFKEISQDLDLSLVQVGTVWGMVSLAGICTYLIGGMLGDLLGLRKIAVSTLLYSAITYILIGYSNGFVTLTTGIFLFGIGFSLLTVNMAKISKIWFSGQRFALANGVLATGMSIGSTSGALLSSIVLSPLLGGWSNVIFMYSLVSFILCLLWLISMGKKEGEQSVSDSSKVTMKETVSKISRIKKVWLLGVVFTGFAGCIIGITGYLPLYLRNIGWGASSADITLVLFNIASAFGSIPVALLSDRIGKRKIILCSLLIISFASAILLPFFKNETVLLLSIILGFTRDSGLMLIFTMALESKGVSLLYAGTAIGLLNTIGRFGGFFSPVVGNSLASLGSGAPFFFWASLSILALAFLYFVKESE